MEKIPYITATLLSACLIGPFTIGSYALAAETAATNVFNADMSNPDLSLAVRSFEQVCMPFVLHETELTRLADKAHMSQLMKSRGYAFQATSSKIRRVLVEPARVPWKPPNQALASNTEGSFSVFNRVSVSSDTLNSVPSLNPWARGIPARYRTISLETDTYREQDEPRLMAMVGWNYPSQKDPGKSCAITLEHAVVEPALFLRSFIKRDEDWIETPIENTRQTRWSQCVSDADNNFEFMAEYNDDKISISVTRSDFYEPELCDH